MSETATGHSPSNGLKTQGTRLKTSEKFKLLDAYLKTEEIERFQSKKAKALGIQPQHYGAMLKGKRNILPKYYKMLLEFYNVTEADFIPEAMAQLEPSKLAEQALTKLVQEVDEKVNVLKSYTLVLEQQTKLTNLVAEQGEQIKKLEAKVSALEQVL